MTDDTCTLPTTAKLTTQVHIQGMPCTVEWLFLTYVQSAVNAYAALTYIRPRQVYWYMALCQIHQALQPSSLLRNLSRLLSSPGSLRNHSRIGTLVRALWTCSEAVLTSRLSCKASRQ